MTEKREKLTRLTFPCMIALVKKTVAHTFLPSFDNALRSGNFATMVTGRDRSPLYLTKLSIRKFTAMVKNKSTGQGHDINNTFSKFLVLHYKRS